MTHETLASKVKVGMIVWSLTDALPYRYRIPENLQRPRAHLTSNLTSCFSPSSSRLIGLISSYTGSSLKFELIGQIHQSMVGLLQTIATRLYGTTT